MGFVQLSAPVGFTALLNLLTYYCWLSAGLMALSCVKHLNLKGVHIREPQEGKEAISVQPGDRWFPCLEC